MGAGPLLVSISIDHFSLIICHWSFRIIGYR